MFAYLQGRHASRPWSGDDPPPETGAATIPAHVFQHCCSSITIAKFQGDSACLILNWVANWVSTELRLRFLPNDAYRYLAFRDKCRRKNMARFAHRAGWPTQTDPNPIPTESHPRNLNTFKKNDASHSQKLRIILFIRSL